MNMATIHKTGFMAHTHQQALWIKYCPLFIAITTLALIAISKPVYILPLIVILCLWSVLNVKVAMFILIPIAIAQGKVGFLSTTSAEVIIDDIYLVELFFPVFLTSILINGLITKERVSYIWRPCVREALIFAVLFSLWTLLAAFYASWLPRALLQAAHTVIFCGYLMIISTFSAARINTFMKMLVLWGLFYFFMAFLCVSGVALEFDNIRISNHLTLRMIFMAGGKRASLLSPPAVTSAMIGLAAWAGYSKWGVTLSEKRIVYLLIAFLITVGAFLTRTRSEMVGFLGGALLVTVTLCWPKKCLLRGVCLCLSYFILVWIVAAGVNMADAFKRIQVSADTSQQASLGIRLDLWKEGLAELINTWGLGNGTGGFFEYKDIWPHAHNVYFSVLFDLGIPGMILWLGIFISIARAAFFLLRNLPHSSKSWITVLFMSGYFVQLLLSGLLQHEYTHFIWWFFPGLFLAQLNIASGELDRYQFIDRARAE